MKYYFWILGCAMNYSDAERMAAVLDSLGYTKTEIEAEADLFIAISCSVRESAMLSIYGKVKELNEYRIQNKEFKTILTGCVLEKDKKKLGKVFDVMMEIEDLPRLPTLLTSLRGTSDEAISDEGDCRAPLAMTTESEYLSITPHYESTFRAYVPISTGCDNFCSYCAVPYTRGREKSRPLEEIVSEVKKLIKNGYKEITLVGQNVNSYGHGLTQPAYIPTTPVVVPAKAGIQKVDAESLDSRLRGNDVKNSGHDNSLFIDLLKSLDLIAGDHRIYFYSNHPKDMTIELIQTLATLKYFPHYIHLPLQSGNDEILRLMNRHNTKEKYLQLVAKIRKALPDVTLTTDIIVGFPGETEAQFADTVDVMQQVGYDMAFIAQYSPRPGTVSAKMEDNVTKEEKVRREKALQGIVKTSVLAHNQKLIGTIQKVLIDEVKKDKYYGRTEGYKVVEVRINHQSSINNQPVIPGRKPGTQPQTKTDLIGRFVNVKIESVSSWKLFGTIVY
jgi:tRNA-2-methylthio-N6-dimethylallyladenosine synthase